MPRENEAIADQLTLSGEPASKPHSQQIADFVSGLPVRATPEEMDSVQTFSRRLVEEFGYPRQYLQTRPQFRIKASPSGEEVYPVDIAVFKNESRSYDNLFMIVECKRRNRVDGLKQLQIYLGLSSSQIGVWFNGQEHIYLQKILRKDGSIVYQELPSIPYFGQRIEDIGKFKRADLKPPTNLKVTFRDIRNHLAGMTTGITRDETMAQEIINILFCKIYDEIHTAPNEQVKFRAGVDESPENVKKRMTDLFEDHVKSEYSDVFDQRESINLDQNSLRYVVGELQNYSITEADRQAIGDAFEIFIGPALRGAEGQFFTPRNVVQIITEILDPFTRQYVIDPACGTGGFLVVALEYIWQKIDEEGKKKNWNPDRLASQKREVASKFLRGIDKDSFLAKVTKAYMAIVGDGRGGVFCENSLQNPNLWGNLAQDRIKLGMFDLVITNPPHGSKIAVKGNSILEQFHLARVWKKDRSTGQWVETSKLRDKQSPQVLFIERCLQLLKLNGRMAIILPESLFGNPSHGYIVAFLRKHAKVIGIVSMPEELFQPHTHNKTCVLFVENAIQRYDDRIFMSIVKWCGHDSRGNLIPHDEVPLVASRFRTTFLSKNGTKKYDRLGFTVKSDKIRNDILIPKYYNPEIDSALGKLSETHELVTMKQLMEQKVLSVGTGVEIGRLSYGTGPIPFIRTSDISNWELKIDPKVGVSNEIYERYQKKAAVKVNDILMVRDGTYLIGTTCMITQYDTRILFQSHIYRIRILKPDILSPYLLLALLNTPIAKKQIKAKQFTQDIIDTLGGRIMELVIPIPKDDREKRRIVDQTKKVVEERALLRESAKNISIESASTGPPTEEDQELVKQL